MSFQSGRKTRKRNNNLNYIYMANNSPTLVMASLSDDQLKKSIDSLVTHVDEAMKKMVQSTNNAVGEMEAKLKSLGNLKIDSGGTNDGGASKRAKSQNAETDAVEKNIAARDKQIKKNREVSMSFDQMQTALEKATRLPSEMRIPDMGKSARDSYIAFMQGYKQQSEQIRRLMEEEQKAMQQRRQGVVDGFTKTIEERKARIKELSEEVAKLYKERPDGYRDAIRQRTEEMDALKRKIRELTEAQKTLADSPIGASNRYLELEKEYNRIKNIMIDTTNVQRQSTQETEKQAQSAQRYTEEIRKQAQAIRSSKEWQEKGHVVVGDVNYYDKERANVSKRDKQLLLSLEEQIVQAQQNEAEAARRVTQETRNQAQAQQQVQQSALGTARIIESVHEMQRRSANFQKGNASVPTFTVELESAKRLSDRLKELREQYNNMNFGQRFGKDGQVVAQQIREIARQGQKLNNELNRPTKKEVFGLSEKTLDDIAYKMRQLSAYRGGLDASKQSKEIAQVNDEYNRLKKRMDEVMQKNQQMIASNTALGRSWNYMKNRLAFYFTVGAGTAFIKNLIEVRSQYEMNERALGILVNSAERGTQIFNELSQMALVSPYTLIELSAAAKQLTAYDVAAKDVVDTTRRLADMAAAVGIPIERLTYALGQIKAYGYLNARDARMFANAGIPLVKQLSEYYTELEGRLVSTADIYDRIKKKSIGYEEVTSVIAKMTDEGGKFYDFQAKMAETLKVQLANLTLAWNNMLNAMGEETQGVLVGSISTLKQVFLHWKDIEHVLYELIVAFGAYKAYQIITTRLMGATAASLDAQVLAMKRNKAAMLEKQSLTRKLTYDEAKLIATQNQVTAADYRNALSGKQLTKQKALLLAALYKNNVQLKAALVNMGLLTTAEAASITRGKALNIVFKSIGISIKNVALAIKAFAASMLPLLVLGAIYELYHAWDSYGEHVKEVNKQAAEHAKEAFENIKQYLESDVTSALQDRLSKGGKVESDAAGQKAWDEMREKIELSSSASNAFIAKLMQISDINARLSAGFGYLEDIQRVAGVMQTLEKDAVKVSSTVLGGLFEEGLKDDLEDFIDSYEEYVSLSENLKQNGVGEKYFNDIKDALEELRGEIDKTTNSIYDIASKEGFNTNEQREFFEREISEIAQAEQMGAKETRIFRMQAEKEYYAYARAQLVAQLEYQQGAQKAATEKRIKDLDNEFGTNKALQESFFTWLTEKQDHAVKNMLRGKTQEEIKQGEWLKGSNAKWVEEMARKFSKEYNVSFDDLRRLVLQANTWSINIPVFFQTIGQPLSDVQRDYEARTGKKFSSNPLIKDAKTQVEILDTLKKKQKEVANEMATAEKAGGKYWEDNKQRYKEENDALVADIHAYNALTDAEEKANKKSGKGGSKKDPLLDALKQEISLVEKLQGDYDKLAKSGASQSDALDTIRSAYGKTIRLLNTQLQSYGLPQINISQLITGKDPNKALAHFKQTLDTLVSKGMLTLERSKELEAVVEKFTLSAKTYNLDMITKGLNSELDRFKEEYELAVAIDADPELGGIFADMFDLNIDQLPHTISEYAQKVTAELNKALKERGDNIQLPTIYLTKDDIDAFRKMSEGGKLNTKSFEEIQKAYQDFVSLRKKAATDVSKIASDYIREYGDLSAQIQQIEIEKNDALMKLNEIYNTDALRQTQRYLDAKFAIEDGAKRKQAKATFDALKKEADYERFFTAIDTLTKKDALSIKNKIKKGIIDAFKNGGLTISQFRKEIKALEEQFDKLSQPTSNWISYLNGGFDKLIQRAKETGQEIETIGEKISITGKVDEKDKNYLQSLGNIFSNGKGGNTDFSSLMSQFGKDMKGLGSNISKAGQGMQGASSNFASTVSIIDMIIKNIHQTVQSINSVIQELDSVRNEENKISNAYWEGFSKSDSYASSGWENLKSGNISGAIADTANSIISIFNTFENAKTDRINSEIKESEREVKRLENSYKILEFAADKAYGTAISGANQATKANKELQLAELKRQLALEQSRSGKARDEDKIIQLRGDIIELEQQIEKSSKDIVNNLLDISSHGDFFEEMISEMISAFKNGEDAMKVFEEKWSAMIDNMIMKTIVSQVLSQWINTLERGADEILNRYTEESAKKMADAESSMANLRTMDAGDFARWIYENDKENFDKILESLGERNDVEQFFSKDAWFDQAWDSGLANKIKEAYFAMLNSNMSGLQSELDKASLDATGELIDYYAQAGDDFKQNYLDLILSKIKENWKFGEDSQKELSALQQGIQGITEDTAGALEAYMNGVSQQVYLHSDLLTQIRDAVVGIEIDAQIATQAQMLLQLQQSYTVQMAIQGILEGWSSPNGMSVRVEMQ